MSKVVRKNDENKSEYNKYYEILSKVEKYVDNLINNKEATPCILKIEDLLKKMLRSITSDFQVISGMIYIIFDKRRL